MEQKQKHFVLVHGACHGAWCWYKVATRLRSEGHRVTSLDMAAAGANPKRVEELGSFSDYYQPLMEFMADLPSEERVVLVGHSLGGLCISVAMEKFPAKIAVAVFVTALMPGPDLSVLDTLKECQKQQGSLMDSDFTFGNGEDKLPTSFVFGPKLLSTKAYQLSPPQDLTLATMLMRPVVLFGEENMLKDVALSKEKYGSVRRAFLVCDNDKVLKQGFQEWMIENNPTHEVKVIRDADHMAMFSRYHELCVCLQDLAGEYV